jgi:rhamnosyl/mannosyltransferase
VGDGPQRAAWAALAQELGIADRVQWLGEVADDALPGLYRQAHIFVLPANARAEAFGTVLLEAMASGLPCVTTEVGTGTSWVVQDGVTGRVTPPQDVRALADALAALLADPPLCAQMGQAARARVLAEFDQARMVEWVLAVYEDALRRRGRRA